MPPPCVTTAPVPPYGVVLPPVRMLTLVGVVLWMPPVMVKPSMPAGLA